MKKEILKKIIIKDTKQMINSIFMIIAIILLISLLDASISTKFYSTIFSHNNFVNVILADIFGSIMAGNPINGYIISKDMLKNGLTLIIITTFILAWTTVGLIQLPMEMEYLGKKFAIVRNFLSFIFAPLIALLTLLIYNLL